MEPVATTAIDVHTHRIAFSHGGGALASLLPRLAEGVRVFPALRKSVHEDGYTQARRFFYDTLVYDKPTLRHLLSIFGNTQMIVGTNFPFNFHDRTPVKRILRAAAGEDARASILHANARRFLNLEVLA